MPSFSMYTLGCKLNQLESEALADAFKRAGWDLAPPGRAGGDREIVIVNTCTVTSKAEQKARRIIRRALEDNPRARVIVTGCYAQLDGDAIAALGGEGRLLVVPGDRKGGILDLPGILASGGDWPGVPEPGDPFRFNPEHFSFHSRPFLKIEDGCDNRCSFCRVSIARGGSRSLAAERALSLLKALEDRGAGEAVLTGVNINQYRDGGRDLAGLLALLLGGTTRIALRLSSLEPEGITPALLDVLAHPRIRPHFHLSIQSGSPRILERMRRPYGPEEVERGAALLRAVKGDPFLACDIIAGFPGETAEDFEQTLSLCRRIAFAWIHGFPYSPRPGTEAFSFKDPVREGEVSARLERLTALALRGRRDYAGRWTGAEVEAVFEEGLPRGIPAGYAPALSANYLKLLVRLPPGAEAPPGRPLRCRIRPLPGPEGAGDFDGTAELLEGR